MNFYGKQNFGFDHQVHLITSLFALSKNTKTAKITKIPFWPYQSSYSHSPQSFDHYVCCNSFMTLSHHLLCLFMGPWILRQKSRNKKLSALEAFGVCLREGGMGCGSWTTLPTHLLLVDLFLTQQGRIHGYPGLVWVGRGTDIEGHLGIWAGAVGSKRSKTPKK